MNKRCSPNPTLHLQEHIKIKPPRKLKRQKRRGRLSPRSIDKLERDVSELLAALHHAGGQGPEYASRLGLLSAEQARQMKSRKLRQMQFRFLG